VSSYKPPTEEGLLASLRRASRVVVFTGSGVSAESGVPTFRDAQTGLWANFDATELATPDAFRRDPALVWGWYEWRRATVQMAQPNAAHRAIVAMASRVPTFTLITQNVDDLHERAGSRDVLHLHGQLARPYCQDCGEARTPPAAQRPLAAAGTRIEPPACMGCGGRVRPGVVWFGESLPEREWLAATEAASRCEVFFCVGTSSLVYPAASLTSVAMGAGAVTVQVNRNPTEIDDAVTWSIRGAAGEVLPRTVEKVWGGD
jgi:NAD-dependent protein deacetylase/lipoamidase